MESASAGSGLQLALDFCLGSYLLFPVYVQVPTTEECTKVIKVSLIPPIALSPLKISRNIDRPVPPREYIFSAIVSPLLHIDSRSLTLKSSRNNKKWK